jgi:N-acetylneuraminate synthase
MTTLRNCFPGALVGYSGHEVGVWTTLCAVAMGARIVERHITLDRSMKGSDHSASLEPKGLELLCREIRQFEKAKGSPEVGPQECEKPDMARLRGAK